MEKRTAGNRAVSIPSTRAAFRCRRVDFHRGSLVVFFRSVLLMCSSFSLCGYCGADTEFSILEEAQVLADQMKKLSSQELGVFTMQVNTGGRENPQCLSSSVKFTSLWKCQSSVCIFFWSYETMRPWILSSIVGATLKSHWFNDVGHEGQAAGFCCSFISISVSLRNDWKLLYFYTHFLHLMITSERLAANVMKNEMRKVNLFTIFISINLVHCRLKMQQPWSDLNAFWHVRDEVRKVRSSWKDLRSPYHLWPTVALILFELTAALKGSKRNPPLDTGRDCKWHDTEGGDHPETPSPCNIRTVSMFEPVNTASHDDLLQWPVMRSKAYIDAHLVILSVNKVKQKNAHRSV